VSGGRRQDLWRRPQVNAAVKVAGAVNARHVPRRHRSWRRGTPVNEAYLGAKIYGAEVRAYK
jgi:hypothetical protein